jgi:hypothetical protein
VLICVILRREDAEGSQDAKVSYFEILRRPFAALRRLRMTCPGGWGAGVLTGGSRGLGAAAARRRRIAGEDSGAPLNQRISIAPYMVP